LGIAFQLQDDYLDAFGDPETFGKQVGGDIIENKKTYLYIKALESSDAKQQQELSSLYSDDSQVENEDKIKRVKAIFKATGAAEKTQEAIKAVTSKAFDILESISITDSSKSILKDFGIWLMNRRV
jgi:geranylgeranyl diphosphate synthase type II